MRSVKQFVMVLAITLGAGASAFAGQHFSAPHNAPHPAAPRPSYHAAPSPRPASQYHVRPVRPAPSRNFVGAEPQTAHPYMMAQHQQVPRPPQQSSRPSGGVPHPPANQRPVVHAQNSAPAHANPQVGSVPHPPQQSGSPEGMVGNARPSVPRPPVIGTPQDVHQGPYPHAGDWLRRYSTLPPQQRQHALENDPSFKRLSPSEQQHYRSQLNNFSSKSPEEQQRLINRMDAWGHLSPTQQHEARATYDQLKAMPADRQQQVNQAFRRLRAMPPSARAQVMNSPEFQSRYSAQERNVIRSMTDINSSLPH